MTSKKVDQFVHLHTHTHFSILDGHDTIDELVTEVSRLGQPAVAVTDHGSLSGLYDLYNAAKKHDITPIAGCEFYMTPSIGSRKSREPLYLGDGSRDDVSGRGAYTHITILAENNIGLKNLFQLSLKASSEGFYQKPRVDLELLEEHREGLIVTTGCPSGEVQTWLRLGHPDKALEYAAKLQDIFGKENVFMELMEHGMAHDLERGVRAGLLDIAKKLDMPLVATNDLHYATKADCESHEQMLAIQTRAVMSEPAEYNGGRRFAFEGGSYYIKSAEEMTSLFPDHPDALKNTLLIAERSSFEVEPDETLRPKLPGIPEGETEASWLRKEAYKGLAKRLPDKVNDTVYVDRLNMELEVLEMKGFSGYFLVVSDFVKWGKFVAQPPVPTGYGRGSAAGSLVAFVMDITDADPIRFDLLFERFINPERDSPPDIDMDFNDTDRERVVEYVKEKYGTEYVAHVATFGKIGAKTAIKDVVRILERPYAVGDALSKALPPAVFGKEIKLSEVYNPNAERYHEAGEFRALVEKEKLDDVITAARKLEGRTRSIGVHAAALVISSRPVVETIPMFMRQNDGAFITQWDYPTAEELGLLKVDFLGLRNLGVISNTIHHIKKTRGVDVDLQSIIQGPMDDPATYKLLQRGDTLGVFQLDGCLAGDTLVSGRKIKDLYKNYIEGKGITSTYSIDLSTGERKRNGIVRFVESGIKMVYRLVSESGRMIEATADHKFMTDSGWKRLGDIDVLVDRVLVDHTVKTLMYRECLDCGTKINSEQRNNNKRCYKCSAKFHSNPTKKASREAIAEARIKFYENGGEPWNKGLNKDTNPILAEVSRKVRAKLNGRNLNKERLSESEYLDYISEMSERMSGKNNPMYGKITRISKKGYREDLGHYVRSSWEADYARVLNFLEEPYKYEPDTFELTRVDGSTMTYTPDFYLVNEDRYVEIKGFMRDIDAEKIKLVQEQHGIKIDVIAQSEFAELELEYKDLVAWECPEIPKSTDWENIISITQIGNQMTYDITMEAPLNNFLANGFMVHNSGMRKLLKQLKPTEFEDISAVLSLYRPGPMGVDAHTDYALRKNGLQDVTPIHPEFKESLADILGPTYQLVVYQEQVQRIAQRIAGYTLAQADLLRRAMGKKKRYIIDAEFVPFSEGAKANGYSDEAIKTLWDILVPFADYAFNKSHTVGYGLISYVTAYLKANYPAEFMSALLSSVADKTDQTALYLNECKHMGITVYPPAVSRSIEDYRPVSETEIYFGLKAIRGMGSSTAEEIVKARGDKPFLSLSDFMHRMPDALINKRVLEGLAQGGGFDDFGIPRKSLISAFPDMLKAVQKARKKASTGMVSLFDDEDDDMLIFDIMDIGEYTKLEKLKLERHALGLYVSDHPLNGLQIDSQSDATVYDLISETIPVAEGGWGRPQKLTKVSGIITSLEKKRTKAGASFAVGTIEDMTGGIPFAMFSKVFEEYGADMKLDGVYQFTGQHRKRSEEDEIQFIIDSVRPLDFGEHGHLNVKVRLTARQWLDGRDKFLKRLERHQIDKGSLIQMSVLDGKEIHDFTLDGVSVKRSPQLIADIRELFGIDAIGRWRSVE